jgi:hypothetical protein
MQTANFTFVGVPGFVARDLKGTFVSWGNANFQIEAAKPELRAVIEEALANASQAATQANRRAHVGSLSRNARRAAY